MVRKTNLSATLRHKVVIQQPVVETDSVGEPIETFSHYATRKAKVSPLGGRETYRLQQYFSEATNVILMRYDSLTSAINTKMRILFDSRVFNIESVINVDEMNREIRVVCTEQT